MIAMTENEIYEKAKSYAKSDDYNDFLESKKWLDLYHTVRNIRIKAEINFDQWIRSSNRKSPASSPCPAASHEAQPALQDRVSST